MEIFEERILELDLEQINELFESFNSEHSQDNQDGFPFDPEYIIEIAQKIKVDRKDQIDELWKEYKVMMESNKEKVIKKIPVITSKMMNEKFLSRPSQGIQMFK